MKFNLRIDPLDLDLTLGCGQTFRWRYQDDGSWEGPLGNQLVKLRMRGKVVHVDAVPGGSEARGLVLDHLRAKDDVGRIQQVLSRDPVLAPGISQMKGLRIVKTDEWETLASFILATYANIPRIMKMVDTLATRFGEPIADGVYAFPTVEKIGGVTKSALESCGLGYRAKYIYQVSHIIDADKISAMRRLSYNGLRRRLIELPGVGEKVADCVSLFGFGKLEAFPIDIWMERAMARLYGRRGSYARLRQFAQERFGEYAGYAQEYIYHNERTRSRSGVCAFKKN